ncbi:polysaccharide biosynthesis/export family protein [Thermodesulfobacteriota bacterium]
MKLSRHPVYMIFALFFLINACATTGDVVTVSTISNQGLENLSEAELKRINEIKETKRKEAEDHSLKKVIQETPNYTVSEYLALNPDAINPTAGDYWVGGYDVIDILIYEETDLSRENVRIDAKGYISFPLIGRLKVDGLTTSEIEKLISRKLVQENYILDAHVSVDVKEYNSKKYIVLGAVGRRGTYSLRAKERVLDAISKSGGIDFEQGGKQGMIIRTLNADTPKERKIVIKIDLSGLLEGGIQESNILLQDRDLLYIPKPDYYYIIKHSGGGGKYPYMEKNITIVEAIAAAGGFQLTDARNRTYVIRVEDGVEKIYKIKVDAITKSGKRKQDFLIKPDDMIVIPESFF